MLAKAIALHGNSVGTGGDYSTGAAQVILPRVVGSMEVYEQQTSAAGIAEQQNHCAVGSDLLKTSKRTGGARITMFMNITKLKAKVAAGEIGHQHRSGCYIHP